MEFKGSIVKEKRQEQGHKQYYFALLTGISQAQLSKIENGKAVPSLSELIMISRVLDKEIDFFFEGKTL